MDNRGDMYLSGSPRVYLHKDGARDKALFYWRYVQLLPFGLFYAVMWKVRVDSA